MPNKHYWQIGHKDPNDIIWLFDDLELYAMPAGNNSHETLFGKNYEQHFHGRYEKSTGYCSIVPSKAFMGFKRPPQIILNALKSRFSVTKFHYYSDGIESFTPNPTQRS